MFFLNHATRTLLFGEVLSTTTTIYLVFSAFYWCLYTCSLMVPLFISCEVSIYRVPIWPLGSIFSTCLCVIFFSHSYVVRIVFNAQWHEGVWSKSPSSVEDCCGNKVKKSCHFYSETKVWVVRLVHINSLSGGKPAATTPRMIVVNL